MVLRLQYLKYQTSGNKIFPYFLTAPKDNEIPLKLLSHFESNLGKARRIIDFETPLTWTPDSRIIRALVSTILSRYYHYESLKLVDLISKEEVSRFQRLGISNLEEFRLWFWNWVQNYHKGYLSRSHRQEAHTVAAKILQLKSVQLEDLMTAHRDEHAILHRNNGRPTPEELIGAYNFEVVETLLYNCETVTILLKGGSLGSAARTLLQITKRFGVLVDLESVDDSLKAIIEGPRIFFGRASSFGWNIAQVLTRLLLEAPKLSIEIKNLTIDVILRDRHYIVQLTMDSLPSLNPKEAAREEEAFLDSKVEKQFYWSWHNNKFRGWDIIREPAVFSFQSNLIIPDFALIKDDKKVLVEIIGYWREEYTQKKRAQLNLLQDLGLKDMILLVDTKHRQHFKKFAYPVIFYRSRGKRYEIPYGKILKLLPD